MDVADGDADTDTVDGFKVYFGKEDLSSTEFVGFGERVFLDFGGNVPDRVEVLDSILSSDGGYMYNEKATVVVDCDSDNGGFYFVVVKHLASAFSSVIEEGRMDLRGYMVRASWGGESVDYGFVINTAASY